MEIAIQVSQKDGADHVTYVGPINEESEVHLQRLLETLGSNVVVNFNQVEYVNSCGVRAWINFMRDLENGRQVTFEECTPEIVMQMNMIPSFKGKAAIKSVYGSYTCDACSKATTVLFEKGKNLPESEDFELPEPNCSHCGEAGLELDELEDEFFAFSMAG